MMRVLFVCTGNICRSPAGEAVLALHAERAGVDVDVDSAGTHGYHVGDAPDHRGIRVGQGRGYSLSHLRARKVCADDFDQFDLIFAMDRGHLKALQSMKPPACRANVVLFMEHCTGRKNVDVPDPYYGDVQDFELMYDMIEGGIGAFINEKA